MAGAVLGVSALAWAVLASGGPLSHAMHHAHHHVPPDLLSAGAAFVASWTLMVLAMMLPTALPLAGHLAHGGVRSVVGGLTAYVAAWALVGVGVFGLATAFAAAGSDGFGVLALLFAGAWQLTDARRRCLAMCHAHGGAGWASGWAHGWCCVGACGPLMLLMVPFFPGSLAFMAALGAWMGVEKGVPAAERWARPLGAVAIGVGLALVSLPQR